MIPEFTEDGILPPGVHETDVAELRAKLAWSGRRTRLVDGIERALPLMARAGVGRVYLDGSFVTDKDRPGDVDGCYDVVLGPEGTRPLDAMRPLWPPTPDNRDAARGLFGLDVFPADTIEAGSGQPFLEFFQTDREGRRRGVLVLEIGRS